MAHLNQAESGITRPSLIDGLIEGDPDTWNSFCETYGDLIARYAARRLPGRHRDDVEDVVQNVFKTFLGQRNRHTFSYRPGQGRFRDYLKTCVRNEALALLRRRPGGISLDGERPIDPVDDDQDDPDFTARYFLTALDRAITEVRARCRLNNEPKWRSFVERVLHRRPADEVAAELGIKTASVYQNVLRVLEEIFETCRQRYLADFGEDDLSRLLQESGPKVMEDLSARVLAMELAGPAARVREALDYFREILHRRLPALRAEATRDSPASWAAFRQYTRALSDGVDPGRPDPSVSKLLERVDRLLREHCEADLGDLEHYHTLRNLGPNAVAIFCGGPHAEEIIHGHDQLP
ncbi:MAG: ylaC [Planctomycetota bacterium]|nr:ylaC [Planctomycetota bacterium]